MMEGKDSTMQRVFQLLLVGVFIFTACAGAQVTIVSPEEGKKALNEMRQRSSQPASTQASQPDPAPAITKGLLPDDFAGWTAVGPTQSFGAFSAATLAGGDGAVLVEYGFAGAERRQFTRDSQTIELEALRMRDSSGSYGLYTFFRGEDWEARDVGRDQVAVRGNELLLRKEEVVVRGRGGEQGKRLSEADVQELLSRLGVRGGGPLPTVQRYLPTDRLIPKTRKYVLGPVALSRVAPGFPVTLADFELGAEIALGRYQERGSSGLTLLIVSYPIPQIAASKIQSWQESAQRSGGQPVTVLFARRVGALLGFVSGAESQAAADTLLQRLRYEMQVTWNEPVPKPPKASVSEYLINLFKLVGLLLLFATVAGMVLGLIRIVAHAWYPHQIFDRPEETEIIRLNINYSK